MNKEYVEKRYEIAEVMEALPEETIEEKSIDDYIDSILQDLNSIQPEEINTPIDDYINKLLTINEEEENYIEEENFPDF